MRRRDFSKHILKGMLLLFIFTCISACTHQEPINNVEQSPDQSSRPLQRKFSKTSEEFPPIFSNEKNRDLHLFTDRDSVYDPASEPSNEIEQLLKMKANTVMVKGIYVSGWIAGSRKMDKLIKMVDETKLNAMVIDIKNDSGEVTYDSKVDMVNEIHSDRRKMISNMGALIQRLKGKEIYIIARIVAFKDPYLANKRPELALHYKSGGLWKDRKGISWVDPYKKEVWRYNLELAKEAATLGFDEIQFDYVRFPDNGKKVDQEVNYSNPQGLSKSQVISDFLTKARKELHTKEALISADVFGLTTSTSDDMGIGQDWNMISQNVDFISPMVYPSHYSKGIYGLTHPDLKPYEVVKHAMDDGNKKNSKLISDQKSSAHIRPWIQSFTATWIHPHLHYTHTEVKLQIKAAQEKGVEEYLLWNPLCNYTFN